MAAIVTIYLDVRIKKKNEIYPVKIRVTYERERKYFGLDPRKVNELMKGSDMEKFAYYGRGNFSIEKSVFQKAVGTAPRGIYKELHDLFNKFQIDYQSRADMIKPFSFETFSDEMDKKKAENDVFAMFDRKIEELEKEERYGSADNYFRTMKSLKAFTGKNKLTFEYFTVGQLKKYEAWMKENDRSITTIGIYLRSFRALMNEAIKSGITENYPFGSGGYKIQKGASRKIALTKEEIKLLFNYTPTPESGAGFYYDMWKLSYILNGINIKDLSLLKQKNIRNDFLSFVREKTRNSVQVQSEIKIYLGDEANEIINRWKIAEKDGYLLPILQKNDSAKIIKQKVGNLVRAINNAIKNIAKELKIDKNISCYTARHTWATQMMRHGASVSFIGKQLGHTSTSTTDLYLSSFDDEEIISWQKKVTEF